MNRTIRSAIFSASLSASFIATISFVATLAVPVAAQVVGGTISGVVTDTSGAAIPNARVSVHNDETGNERHLTTAGDGRYAAPSIPVGGYTIVVTADGFNEQQRQGITLSIGQAGCCTPPSTASTS